MTIKFVVAHRADPNNVGDLASNPLQYFLSPEEYQVIDVAKLGEESYPSDVPLIVGGGGLIANNFMGDFFPDLLESADRLTLENLWEKSWTISSVKNKEIADNFNKSFKDLVYDALNKVDRVTAPRFIWGAGHNNESDIEFEKIRWPKSFSGYKLVGLRDYHPKSKFEWTPCASCMHPAFNKKYEIKNEVIWFEHKKQLIKDFGTDPIPRFINSGSNIEQTIELLGSARVILTNSYHGAYWGTLLNRKVILVGGSWSSKFKWLKHKPVYLDKKGNWKDHVDIAPTYEDALDECRHATINFWDKIKNSL